MPCCYCSHQWTCGSLSESVAALGITLTGEPHNPTGVPCSDRSTRHTPAASIHGSSYFPSFCRSSLRGLRSAVEPTAYPDLPDVWHPLLPSVLVRADHPHDRLKFTAVRAVPPADVPIQTVRRAFRGQENPGRPRLDHSVWTEHIEVYLPGATRQERQERLVQLRTLEATMLERMRDDPRFEVLRRWQTLQRNPPRRSARLQQRWR